MKDKLNVVIIGFGGMGVWHYEQMKESKIMNVIGIFDIDPTRQELARKSGLRVFVNPVEVGITPEVDAVLIATPNDLHMTYALYYAAFKKHIICEKPAALRAQDYIRMAQAAKDNGVILATHQNKRWDADFLTVKKLIDSEYIGKVYNIESNVTGSHGIPGGWRKKKEHGGGMMLDWGVHLIDQILQIDSSKIIFMDSDLSFIEGFNVDDGFCLKLRFESGLKVSINVDTNCFVNPPRWRLSGLDGTAVINDWSVDGEIIKVKEREDKYLSGINAGNGFTKTMADRSNTTVEREKPNVILPEPFAFYRNVLQAVNGGELFIKTPEIVRTLKIMETALKSYVGTCEL